MKAVLGPSYQNKTAGTREIHEEEELSRGKWWEERETSRSRISICVDITATVCPVHTVCRAVLGSTGTGSPSDWSKCWSVLCPAVLDCFLLFSDSGNSSCLYTFCFLSNSPWFATGAGHGWSALSLLSLVCHPGLWVHFPRCVMIYCCVELAPNQPERERETPDSWTHLNVFLMCAVIWKRFQRSPLHSPELSPA